MPAKTVHFASVRMKDVSADASLPRKYARMLDVFPLKGMFDGKRTAVKMHVGGNVGYTTVHSPFVRILGVQDRCFYRGDTEGTVTQHSNGCVCCRIPCRS